MTNKAYCDDVLIDKINEASKRREEELFKKLKKNEPVAVPQKVDANDRTLDVGNSLGQNEKSINNPSVEKTTEPNSLIHNEKSGLEESTLPSGALDSQKKLNDLDLDSGLTDDQNHGKNDLESTKSDLEKSSPKTFGPNFEEAKTKGVQNDTNINSNQENLGNVWFDDSLSKRESKQNLDKENGRTVEPPTLRSTKDNFSYIGEDSRETPGIRGYTKQNFREDKWLESLKQKQEQSYHTSFEYPGPFGVGTFDVKPKSSLFGSLMGGAGPYDARVSSAELGYSPGSYHASLSLLVDRAQWLDPKTNTGKLATSSYGLVCAGGAYIQDLAAFTPCLGGGMSFGQYKDRNYLNAIEVHNVEKKTVGIAMVKGVVAYNLIGTHVIDWAAGYSQDIFLWGGFAKVLFSTPVPTIYVGLQTYGIQRNALIISTSFRTN
jgi:hypothetical protein